MPLQFVRVNTGEDVTTLAALANEVWHEYFAGLMSFGQIDYMVEKFQSAPAIADQLENQNYEYYFMRIDGINIGYVGIRPDSDGRLFLSKLYILKPYRGLGYASLAFDFIEQACRDKGLTAIWLTVNKHNSNTIAIYTYRGFCNIDSRVLDIGEGYVMDDYIMEKQIG